MVRDKNFNEQTQVQKSGIAYQRPMSKGRITSLMNGDNGYHRA